MPAVLMRLMRHRTMTVTMAFYAVNDAESVAEAAWAAFGDKSGDNSPEKAVFSGEIRG